MASYTDLKPKGYRPRLVDSLVERNLGDFGAIELRGTRWSGKSWTAMAHAESVTQVDVGTGLYADDPDLALIGAQPHAIDEWQDVPSIWNRVRHSVDDSANRPGQFILTGSSSPAGEDGRHSGAGRISRIRMRTMTLAEMGRSSATVSLCKLFDGEFEPQQSRLCLEDYASILCHGGWPALVDASDERAQRTVEEYLDLLFEASMPKLGKDPMLSRRLAVALASYLSAFKLNYFLDELPGWDAPVKARSRVRTKPKRYLDDPSMAAALLSVGPSRLLQDGQLFGMLFEALCVHDLSVYASLLPGAGMRPLRYYADADGLEVDAILELRDGRWAAFEVKLGESKVEQAAKSLSRLKAKVAANPVARNPKPEFMAVLVGNGAFARRRKEDGIYVLPLGTLTA